MKIGLSLSLCVKDIMDHKVDLNDVIVIVSNTCCHGNSFDTLHKQYSISYWNENPDLAWAILSLLIHRNKIIQPRIDDPDHQHKSNPHWIDVPDCPRFSDPSLYNVSIPSTLQHRSTTNVNAPYSITDRAISVFLKGSFKVIDSSNPNFKFLKQALLQPVHDLEELAA